MEKTEFIFNENANKIIGILMVLYGVFTILGM